MTKNRPHVNGPLKLLAAMLLLVSACSTAGPEKIQITTRMDDPVEAVNRLGDEISAARNDNLNILAPDAFALAEEKYTDAKTGLEKGSELKDIFENVNSARAALQKAGKSAELSKLTLADVLKGRSTARAAGATKLGEDYTRAEKKFLELTRAIEKNDLAYAQKNKDKVHDLFRDLEVRAIKDNTLGQVRELIQQAEEADAPKPIFSSLKTPTTRKAC